jgi:hypothetical protein
MFLVKYILIPLILSCILFVAICWLGIYLAGILLCAGIIFFIGLIIRIFPGENK